MDEIPMVEKRGVMMERREKVVKLRQNQQSWSPTVRLRCAGESYRLLAVRNGLAGPRSILAG